MSSQEPDRELRRHAAAALEARRELGPDYEPEILDAFVEKIERRLDERARRHPPAERGRDARFVVTLVSLGVAIPMLGIAGGIAGIAGIVAVCAALVLVNLVFARL